MGSPLVEDKLHLEAGRSRLLPSSGQFATCPVPGAPEALDGAIAVEIEAQELTDFLACLAAGQDEEAFAEGGPGVRPGRLLLDLDAVDGHGLTADILRTDLRLLLELAENHGEDLVRLVRERDNLELAEALVHRLGLTEKRFAAAGGGFIWVVVVVGVALLAGGCATTKPFRKEDNPRDVPVLPGG